MNVSDVVKDDRGVAMICAVVPGGEAERRAMERDRVLGRAHAWDRTVRATMPRQQADDRHPPPWYWLGRCEPSARPADVFAYA